MSTPPPTTHSQAWVLAKTLAETLPVSSELGRAAARLAAGCLELAEPAPGWLDEHGLVRDLGVRQEREQLLLATTRLLLLAADCIRMLSTHGGASRLEADIAERTEQCMRAAGRALGTMNSIETELAARIREPTLAERGLQERRRQHLQTDPSLQVARINQLASEIEVLRQRESKLVSEEEELDEKRAHWAAVLAEHDRRLEEARGEREMFAQRHDQTIRALTECERECIALAATIEGAEARLREVRQELDSLRSDPRNAIRDRVHGAIRVLDGELGSGLSAQEASNA